MELPSITTMEPTSRSTIRPMHSNTVAEGLVVRTLLLSASVDSD